MMRRKKRKRKTQTSKEMERERARRKMKRILMTTAAEERSPVQSQARSVESKILRNTSPTSGKSVDDLRAWTLRWKPASRPS
jgi:hypothetical protein